MPKQEVLVIECLSSANMYVEEIIERGYKALVVNPEVDDAHIAEQKAQLVENFKKRYTPEEFEAMNAPYDSQAILEMVAGHNIVCCVAGSEYGVKLADQVAAALNLPHNNPDTSWRRCTKNGMVQSLEEAGVRAIKTAKVTSSDDIKKFWKDNNIQKAFMKFAEGAAGAGVKACETLEEAVEHYENVKNLPNYFGNNDDDILIQEFIGGDEYVVNTITCQGKTIVSDMWKYHKIIDDEGEVLYQSSKLVEKLDDTLKKLVEYAYKVVQAVDLQYGPCHGEYKIDQNGPVLIETNCRPMGDSTTRDFMLDISGQCIVDWSLDSYLKQDKFLAKIDKNEPYHSIKSSTKKYVILSKRMRGDMSAHFTLGEHLKTYHNHNDYYPAGIKDYPRTTDLGNTPMILKLAGETSEDIRHDIDLMNNIEQNFIDLVVCPEPNLQAGKQTPIEQIVKGLCSSENLIARADECERTLVLTDDEAYEVCKGQFTPVCEDTPKIFDCVLYANAGAGTLNEKYLEIFEMFEYLKPGGSAKICDCAATILPHGKECFNLLKQAARVQ